MAKYKIAWLPGDGIGVDVLEAAKIVLDKIQLDAEYIPGDIGWDFWCNEGDAFPPRTIDLLKKVDAALFGAITSKPAKNAAAELAPALQGKGLAYRSPIVRMRQMFDLYICLRPCKAYPGNPLNYKDDIDLVIFRENTEDLYAGVEFCAGAAGAGGRAQRSWPSRSRRSPSCRRTSTRSPARSTPARAPSGSSAPRSSSPAQHRRKKVTVVHKANVVRATDGLFLETGQGGGEGIPRDRDGRRQRRRHHHVAAEEPVQLRCAGGDESLRRHHLRPCAQMVGGLGFGCSGNIGDEARGLRADARLRAEICRPVQGQPHRDDPRGEDDARLAGRGGEGRRARGGRGRGHPGRQGAHLRHGRQHDPGMAEPIAEKL